MPDLIDRIWSQAAEIERLRRFVADQSTTCYSCEACGHARTTRECLWCENGRLRTECCKWERSAEGLRAENDELRKLCEEAAEAIEGTAAWQCDSLDELCHRLRAAAKGEQ